MRAALVLLLLVSSIVFAAGGSSIAPTRAKTPVTEAAAANYRLFAPAAASDMHWESFSFEDPDEPVIDRNDIASVDVATSATSIWMSLTSASDEGFAIGPGVDGVVMVWFGGLPWVDYVFELRGIEARVEGSHVAIYTWVHEVLEPEQTFTVPYVIEGRTVSFHLPRDLFGYPNEFQFLAAGSDTSVQFGDGCGWQDCPGAAVDFFPDDGPSPDFWFP